jgi:hypothetical protein
METGVVYAALGPKVADHLHPPQTGLLLRPVPTKAATLPAGAKRRDRAELGIVGEREERVLWSVRRPCDRYRGRASLPRLVRRDPGVDRVKVGRLGHRGSRAEYGSGEG